MKTQKTRARASLEKESTPLTNRRIPSTPPIVPTPSATRRLTPSVFPCALVLGDVLALTGAMFLTYAFRFQSGVLPTPLGIPDITFYVASLAVVLPVGIAVFHSMGLYRSQREVTWSHDLFAGVKAAALLSILLAAIAFFYREFSYSRTFLVGYGIATAAAWFVGRRAAAQAQRVLRRSGIGVQRVGIVGGGEMAARLHRKIQNRPGAGLAVVATLEGDEWQDGLADSEAVRSRRIGRTRSFVRANALERIIVTDPELTHDERLDLVEECHYQGVRCEFVPDLFEVMFGRLQVEDIDGIPLVGSRLHPLSRVDRVQKRTLDLIVASSALLIFAPLCALIAILVRLDSKGPVLFRQNRLGRDGREFDMLKFRSMGSKAESASGPVRACRGDDRVTSVGRILRRTSLDELPQLWNVFKGEMSLVGPRPERPYFVDRFRVSIPRYLERHGVKSGVTGWAQVNGLRGDTSIEERTRYDLWYVENWSLALDVKILVLTLFRFLFQEEAY